MTYYALGKQVLIGSKHVADACDPATADTIAEALNQFDKLGRMEDMGERPGGMTFGEWQHSLEQPSLIPACRAYQASDQMICPCGKQWDVNDPDPPECNR